jgi:S1-C subfamily serine protease
VSLYSAAITGDDAAAELQEIKQLMRVEFYGTDVSEGALTTLRAALPHATVDVRGGARLGIAEGQPTMPGSPVGAYVGEVQPGTAAEKAGLATNDVITEIDGIAVTDFQGLTREIAKVKPGDSISLKVLRQGALGQPALEPRDVTVTFSRWGDESLVNPNAQSPLGGPATMMPGAAFLNQR